MMIYLQLSLQCSTLRLLCLNLHPNMLHLLLHFYFKLLKLAPSLLSNCLCCTLPLLHLKLDLLFCINNSAACLLSYFLSFYLVVLKLSRKTDLVLSFQGCHFLLVLLLQAEEKVVVFSTLQKTTKPRLKI